jgi:penicillin-binding protein 2
MRTGQSGHAHRTRTRLWAFVGVVVLLMTTLVGRLAMVQLTQQGAYARDSSLVNTRLVHEPAVRGRILTADGSPLVDNAAKTIVTVEPAALLSHRDGGRALIDKVAAVLGMPSARLWDKTHLCGSPGAPPPPACAPGSPYQPIAIATGVDTRRALSLLEQPENFPGIGVEAAPVRHYPHPDGVNAAQLVGYLGRTTPEEVSKGLGDQDLVGRAGLEQEYDSVLRGERGTTTVAIDRRGVVTRRLSHTDPVPGNDLVTHLDARLQAATEKALAGAVAQARQATTDARGKKQPGDAADTGAAVVLDTRTGAVLAAASYPTYRPEVWTGGISSRELAHLTSEKAGVPLTDRVTSALYPPASTFKVVSLPAAIKSGVKRTGKYDCSSSVQVGGRRFHNFESHAYGMITLRQALVVSCDTVFYRFAYDNWLRLGGLDARSDVHDPFVAMARRFGLGRPTGIDLPGEAAGRIPDRAWKRQQWESTKDQVCKRAKRGYPEVEDRRRAAYLKELAVENCAGGFEFRGGDAVNFAIGQGDVAVTPLQMAVVYAAIANGGTLWTPQVAAGVRTPTGEQVKTFRRDVTGYVDLDPQTWALLRSGLAGVVRDGTASEAFRGFPLDAYPVAGKTGTGEVYGKDATAWFASYGPLPKPRYAVVVVVGQGGEGGKVAAPAARQIWETLRSRGP